MSLVATMRPESALNSFASPMRLWWQSPRSQRGIPLGNLAQALASARWLTCSFPPLLCSLANQPARGLDAKTSSITPIGYQVEKTTKASKAGRPVLVGSTAVTAINPPTVQMMRHT